MMGTFHSFLWFWQSLFLLSIKFSIWTRFRKLEQLMKHDTTTGGNSDSTIQRTRQTRGSGDFSSFGFRGEALSAISAMGDMTIATKTPDSAAFWRPKKNTSIHLFCHFWFLGFFITKNGQSATILILLVSTSSFAIDLHFFFVVFGFRFAFLKPL